MNQNEVYWYLVTKCLTEIFEMPPTTARRKTIAYRKEWQDSRKNKKTQDIIYHEWPVQIASEIAEREVLDHHYDAYLKIEDRPIPEAVAVKLTTKYVKAAAKSRIRRS